MALFGEVEAQAATLNERLEAMVRVQEIVGASRARSEQTAAAARQQSAAREELSDASQDLAGLAVSLDALAGRFRVA